MGPIASLLVAGLLAAEPAKCTENSEIVYQVRYLEMTGLDWRAAHHAQMTPVCRQQSATVWTTTRGVTARLAERADRVIAAPRLTASAEARATVDHTTTRHMMADFRVVPGVTSAEGVQRTSYVGVKPSIESEKEGYSCQLTGRCLDQGVLARVRIEDQQITAMHPVICKINRTDPSGQENPLATTIYVPEVARAEVAGEWLIPSDGALVVSFGARTSADDQGKAVVHERLAVIEAWGLGNEPVSEVAPESTSEKAESPSTACAPAPASLNLKEVHRILTAHIQAAIQTKRAPAPMVPSRSLPMAVSASGEPMPLPPLPPDLTPPTALPGSSEPCATPQTHNHWLTSAPAMTAIPLPVAQAEPRDAASTRTGFEMASSSPTSSPDDCDDESCPASACPMARSRIAASPLVLPRVATRSSERNPETKTYTLRVPMLNNMVIEFRASATPIPAGVVERD